MIETVSVADPDPLGSVSFWEAGSGSALKSEFRSFRGSKWTRGGPCTLTSGGAKMEPCRVCRPVVADSYHGVRSGSGAGAA
jgi:hypothetical protein